MSSSIHHLETSVLKRSEDSADNAEGFQFRSDIAIKAEAPVLHVIFSSFIREGSKCLSMETNSCFESDRRDIVIELPRKIEEDAIRKEYARMLMKAQAEHLKLLSHELPGQNISILCLEFNSEHYFDRLLKYRKVKLG